MKDEGSAGAPRRAYVNTLRGDCNTSLRIFFVVHELPRLMGSAERIQRRPPCSPADFSAIDVVVSKGFVEHGLVDLQDRHHPAGGVDPMVPSCWEGSIPRHVILESRRDRRIPDLANFQQLGGSPLLNQNVRLRMGDHLSNRLSVLIRLISSALSGSLIAMRATFASSVRIDCSIVAGLAFGITGPLSTGLLSTGFASCSLHGCTGRQWRFAIPLVLIGIPQVEIRL